MKETLRDTIRLAARRHDVMLACRDLVRAVITDTGVDEARRRFDKALERCRS